MCRWGGDAAAGRTQVFVLYVSARYLQELAGELRLIGVESWYARPGIGGVLMPRLYVKDAELGWMDDGICASREVSDSGRPQWWFIRVSRTGRRHRICQPGDMVKAARLVVEELEAEFSV